MTILNDIYAGLGISQPNSYAGKTVAPGEIGGNGGFSIPFNVFPSSQSSSSNSSHSGINWNSGVNPTLQPLLDTAVSEMPGLTKALPGNLQNLYEAMMRSALGPNAFQGTLNTLASNNMLDSSVASSAMSKTASDIMNQVGNQGYQSMLEGLKAQLGLSGSLANIAQLGQQSSGGGSSSSSQSDPLAPYRLYADMLMYGGG